MSAALCADAGTLSNPSDALVLRVGTSGRRLGSSGSYMSEPSGARTLTENTVNLELLERNSWAPRAQLALCLRQQPFCSNQYKLPSRALLIP